MSDSPAATPSQATAQPRRGWRIFWSLVLLLSLALNVVLFGVVTVLGELTGLIATDGLYEKFHSGKPHARSKIAVIHIDGVLMEGLLGFMQSQIHQAATDPEVRAVVLRINSPGGTITASENLHHRLMLLTKGDPTQDLPAKPVIVSMGSLAASGGYYIAMPAQSLFAERSTLTGSIGVFAALPNVKELADKIGFRMEVVKAGEVKDSGSMFHNMTDKERALWQNMVDRFYLRFLEVIEEGRPRLKGKLQEDLVYDETVKIRDSASRQRKVNYTRYRADGGVFLADEALRFGLIDQIGYLEDAIEAAKTAAGLTDARVITYERPAGVIASILGVEVKSDSPSLASLKPQQLAGSVTPRVWYLSPQADLAGILAAAAAAP